MALIHHSDANPLKTLSAKSRRINKNVPLTSTGLPL
jgi:hypothetical protein